MEDNFQLTRTYPVNIATLWEVLTDRKHLKQWYFDFTTDWNLKVGSEFEWTAGDTKDGQWLHHGEFLEVKKEEKLVHTWEYPGYSGTSTLSWLLKVVDKTHTELTLTHEFTDPFDPTIPELRKENVMHGWDAILNDGLVDFIKGLPKA